VFTDDPLAARATPVKALHFTELRQAIDSLRTRFCLGAFVWTDATIGAGVTVKAAHLVDLRIALNDVYAAAGHAPPYYNTHGPVTGGATVITVADIAELRAAVLAIW
jgi:hypothetical protein